MRSNLKTETRKDGTSTYRTVDGDMVDSIAFKHYASHVGTTELLYEANPHLLEHPMRLPAGIVITLPAFTPAPAVENRINLWD